MSIFFSFIRLLQHSISLVISSCFIACNGHPIHQLTQASIAQTKTVPENIAYKLECLDFLFHY